MKPILMILFLGFIVSAGASSASDIHWGEAKQAVSIGLQHSTNFPGNGIIMIYAGGTTNYMKNMVRPDDVYQRMEIELRATNSQPVSLTHDGKKYGRRLQTKLNRSRQIANQLKYLHSKPTQIAFIYIDKCFVVEHPGEYELEVRVRLLEESENKLVPVLFEPVMLRLHLKPNTDAPTGTRP